MIQEVRAPTGYLVNGDKVLVKITEDGTDNDHVKTYNEKASNDDVVVRKDVGNTTDKVDWKKLESKNANVSTAKEITLIDTIEYTNLKEGETYTAKA